MSEKNQLSIQEFSRLTGIKRENLRFYDRIGLLKPETRGENNYRYYSRHQLSAAYLISSLRGLGVGIEEIKAFSGRRTTEATLSLFALQDARIQAEIRQLQETSRILKMHAKMAVEALSYNESALFLEEKEREPIFICPPIPETMDTDEGSIFSYDYADAQGINAGFPQGVLLSQARLETHRIDRPDHYYFNVDKGCNAYKPAGLYAVVYGQCDPWACQPLYNRLFDFIQQQGCSICGSAYEEYPMGDFSFHETDQHCVRIAILVQK